MKSMYTKYQEQDLNIDEIKIKLNDNSPFLSNILIFLSLLITLFSLLYNSSLITSNNRYTNTYAIGNQQIEIALKGVEFDKKDNQLADIRKISTQAEQLNNQIYSQFAQNNNENQNFLIVFIALVILTILILLSYSAYQVHRKRTLYLILHEKEQLLDKQKTHYLMFYVE
jgi:Na+/H+ antiporter NhaC